LDIDITKDLEAGFDEVVYVFLTEKRKQEILFQIREIRLDKLSTISILEIEILKANFWLI